MPDDFGLSVHNIEQIGIHPLDTQKDCVHHSQASIAFLWSPKEVRFTLLHI